MKRVLFLAGLERSGGTLLGLVLGQHSRIVALGEIVNMLGEGTRYAREQNKPCSCGEFISGCQFWREVDERFSEMDSASQYEQYNVVLARVSSMLSADHVIVDASKNLVSLKRLLKRDDVDLRVIHFLKDVRAFTISHLDRAEKRIAKDLPVLRRTDAWLPNRIHRSPYFIFFNWLRRHRKIKTTLATLEVPVLQVGYEEMCLYPDLIIPKMWEFAGVSLETVPEALVNTENHIMRGNIMRRDPQKQKIRYDNRWFYRTEWMLPSLLFRHVMRFNRREVYGNTTGSIWGGK